LHKVYAAIPTSAADEKKNMTRQNKAYAYALATVLLWSTVASAFKLSLRYLDPLQLLFYANVVSVLTLFLVLVVQKKLYLVAQYRGAALARAAALGLLNPFLYYVVLFKAYDLLPAQEAQPLNYTWAITLAILSIPLLKQKIGLKEFGAILISYVGVVVISTHGNVLSLRFGNTIGVALALGSTVIWALYWIFNTKDTNDPVAALFLNFVFGLPFVFAATALFSNVYVSLNEGLLGAAYVGVFEMGISFVLWLNALKLSSTTAKVSTLIFFSPFLSLIFIHFLVGEDIRGSTIVGLVFIVAGNVLQQLAGRNRSWRERRL
jgi:drug/metabolite transporter (DMT)-like permease